jgi:hypothetical protein
MHGPIWKCDKILGLGLLDSHMITSQLSTMIVSDGSSHPIVYNRSKRHPMNV